MFTPLDKKFLVGIASAEALDHAELVRLQSNYARDLAAISPDLKENELAMRYAEGLFGRLLQSGTPRSVEELRDRGSAEFYMVGREVLGPLAVDFVHGALKKAHGPVIFPARDATPFYHIARTLITLQPHEYAVSMGDLMNPFFNRKLWGVDDEQDAGGIKDLNDPLVHKLLAQMGFGQGRQITFVEVGCWGTMVDAIKRHMPDEDIAVHFFYSHQPDNIYGYANEHGAHLPESALETFADTWEAFPKFLLRPTELIEDENGFVTASLDDKVVDSPFLKAWTDAAMDGVIDAARIYVAEGGTIDPAKELSRLWELSKRAAEGSFTGILPDHSPTWSEGDAWIKDWKHGKIPPL